MRHSETTFTGKIYCHAHASGPHSALRVSVRLNSDADDDTTWERDLSMYMSEIEWVAFKNSVLAADEKMFGRRHANG